jgi:hypothetical protein
VQYEYGREAFRIVMNDGQILGDLEEDWCDKDTHHWLLWKILNLPTYTWASGYAIAQAAPESKIHLFSDQKSLATGSVQIALSNRKCITDSIRNTAPDQKSLETASFQIAPSDQKSLATGSVQIAPSDRKEVSRGLAEADAGGTNLRLEAAAFARRLQPFIDIERNTRVLLSAQETWNESSVAIERISASLDVPEVTERIGSVGHIMPELRRSLSDTSRVCTEISDRVWERLRTQVVPSVLAEAILNMAAQEMPFAIHRRYSPLPVFWSCAVCKTRGTPGDVAFRIVLCDEQHCGFCKTLGVDENDKYRCFACRNLAFCPFQILCACESIADNHITRRQGHEPTHKRIVAAISGLELPPSPKRLRPSPASHQNPETNP